MNGPVQITGMAKGWRITDAWRNLVGGMMLVGYHVQAVAPWGGGDFYSGHGQTLAAAIQDAIRKTEARKLPTPEQIESLAAELENRENQ